MKSNFTLVGTIKKKGYSITIDHDKTLDRFDHNAFREKLEQTVRDSAALTQYSPEVVGRALRAAIDAHKEVMNNIEDEVLTIRQSEIDQLVDIRDIENLRMFDMEDNEL